MRETLTAKVGHFVRSVWPGGGTYGMRLNHIRPWKTDPVFRVVLRKASSRSLVDEVRQFMLSQCVAQCKAIDGDVAEVGVYRGGTARLIGELLRGSGKQIHLFDTFAGMPDVDQKRDLHRKGDFADTSLESVRASLEDVPNLHFYQGFFPQTAGPIEDKRFSMAHIDVDIYQSVLDCCSFFYPRMNRGGIMIFDDYGVTSCPGAKLAVDEFFKDKPEVPFYIATAQAFVTKH
jgi:O-methyltransferase